MSRARFCTSIGAAAGPWQEACDQIDSKPAVFDVVLLTLLGAVIVALNVGTWLRDRAHLRARRRTWPR